MNRLWICASLIVLTPFLYEYAILEFELDNWYAPSDALNTLARRLQDGWEWLGRFWAKLSSFLTWIRLERLFKAMYNISDPIFQMVVSPFYFLKGYVETARLYDHPWKIRIGSGILCGLIYYLLSIWWKRRRGRSIEKDPSSSSSEEEEEEDPFSEEENSPQ